METPEYSGLRLNREEIYERNIPPGVPRGGMSPLLPTNPNTSLSRDAIINSGRLPGSNPVGNSSRSNLQRIWSRSRISLHHLAWISYTLQLPRAYNQSHNHTTSQNLAHPSKDTLGGFISLPIYACKLNKDSRHKQ